MAAEVGQVDAYRVLTARASAAATPRRPAPRPTGCSARPPAALIAALERRPDSDARRAERA